MKYLRPLILATVVILMSVACTAREAYEGVRVHARRECYKMAEPERSACLEQADQDYDTYNKKRLPPPT